jgi:hypothetical protein
VGLCTFLKPTYAIFALVPIWAGLRAALPRPAERIRSVGMVAIGFLVVAGCFAAWFLARGAFGFLWTEYIVANFQRATSSGFAAREFVRTVYHYFTQPHVILASTAALAGAAALRHGRRLEFEILVLWLFLSAAWVATQGRWQGYLLHVFEVPLLCLSVIGIMSIVRQRAPASALGAAWALALGLASAGYSEPYAARWARMQLGQIDRDAYAAGFDNVWLGFSFRTDVAVAHHLKGRTSPTDVVLALEDPMVNFLAARPTIGRYTSPGPAWSRASDLGPRGHEFLRDLSAHRPRYVVVGPPVVSVPGSLWKTLDDRYPASFVALLRLEYVVDTIIGGSTVLRDGSTGH